MGIHRITDEPVSLQSTQRPLLHDTLLNNTQVREPGVLGVEALQLADVHRPGKTANNGQAGQLRHWCNRCSYVVHPATQRTVW